MKKFALLFVAATLLSGCAIFAPSYPSDVALENQTSFNTARTDQTGWLVFEASDFDGATGIIFYPGGKVEPEAYAELANQLAISSKALVIIPPMPLNLAVLKGKVAAEIQEAFSDIKTWVIGGHSLGGTMASAFAHDSDNVSGLFLLASYPQDKHDFSQSNLAVISIIGDRDGLISQERWNESHKLLPQDSLKIVLNGGNHAGFGKYGPQEDDLQATMSADTQHESTVKALSDWLQTAVQ